MMQRGGTADRNETEGRVGESGENRQAPPGRKGTPVRCDGEGHAAKAVSHLEEVAGPDSDRLIGKLLRAVLGCVPCSAAEAPGERERRIGAALDAVSRVGPRDAVEGCRPRGRWRCTWPAWRRCSGRSAPICRSRSRPGCGATGRDGAAGRRRWRTRSSGAAACTAAPAPAGARQSDGPGPRAIDPARRPRPRDAGAAALVGVAAAGSGGSGRGARRHQGPPPSC